MSEVVYLKGDEKPPKGKPFALIVCRRGRGGDQMISGPSGCTIRIGAESLADTIAALREGARSPGTKIYVRGVMSAASAFQAQTDLTHKRRKRAARIPTIEDLEREEEISCAIADKLRSTVDLLARLAAKPPPNAAVLAEQQVREYLSSAPGDEYAQRRALEKLWKVMPGCKSDALEGWQATWRAVVPRLLMAWKSGA